MSNAFTADREQMSKRTLAETLKACVIWIKRGAGLYPSDTTLESRRD